MAELKKYRVLCSKEQFTDTIFIDIAPENGVTHDMMFYSRLQLYRTQSAKMLEDCGTRSVYMSVAAGHEPIIDFSYADPGIKKPLEHQSYLKLCNKLRPLIIDAYNKMIADGRQSTLEHIMGPTEVENYKDSLSNNHPVCHPNSAKKVEYARTPKEEEQMLKSSEFKEQQKRRQAASNMHAILDRQISPLIRLKQRTFRDGD